MCLCVLTVNDTIKSSHPRYELPYLNVLKSHLNEMIIELDKKRRRFPDVTGNSDHDSQSSSSIGGGKSAERIVGIANEGSGTIQNNEKGTMERGVKQSKKSYYVYQC